MKQLSASYLFQQSYEGGDPLPCCGCEVWVGRGVPADCTCRCHDTVREFHQRLEEINQAKRPGS